MLRIAVQSKGRLFDDTMNLLAEADIKTIASLFLIGGIHQACYNIIKCLKIWCVYLYYYIDQTLNILIPLKAINAVLKRY